MGLDSERPSPAAGCSSPHPGRRAQGLGGHRHRFPTPCRSGLTRVQRAGPPSGIGTAATLSSGSAEFWGLMGRVGFETGGSVKNHTGREQQVFGGNADSWTEGTAAGPRGPSPAWPQSTLKAAGGAALPGVGGRTRRSTQTPQALAWRRSPRASQLCREHVSCCRTGSDGDVGLCLGRFPSPYWTCKPID